MKTEMQTPEQHADHAQERSTTDCQGTSCQTGNCSPCLIVWGLVGVFLIVIALLEAFQ